MFKFLYSCTRPILFSMNPETAHSFSMNSIKIAASLGLTSLFPKPDPDPRNVMGLTFPNPIGLAAGLDKNGDYIDGLGGLGFGFIELGTVTPRPQPGNPQPRMFRIPQANALINRMGFNNEGVDTLVANVRKSDFYKNKKGILGLNIGKNAVTPIEQATDDYIICLEKVFPFADYVAINISSPNTKNLRRLQGSSELNSLLTAIKEKQLRLTDKHKRYVPIAVKIAPDIDSEQIKAISEALIKNKMDAVIATNTTITRDAVSGMKHAEETGGLSGAPVTDMSTKVIRALKTELGYELPIIGVGGIMNGEDARKKIEAGASLVQIFTGMIYAGPSLVSECAKAVRSA